MPRTTVVWLLILCAAVVASAVSPSGAPDDHFLGYKAKVTKKTPAFQEIVGLRLTDVFEDRLFDVRKPREIFVPADKNGEGIVDPDTHLQSYQIKPSKVCTDSGRVCARSSECGEGGKCSRPKDEKRTGLVVENQLGLISVDVLKPDLLLVPTNKDLEFTPAPPDPLGHEVDHYTCYKAKVTRGTPKLAKDVTVSVADQLTSPAKALALKKVRHLCTPVDKAGEGILNPDGHLLCYLARRLKDEPKHDKRTGVQINNQFGPLTLDTIKESEFCVPSVVTVGLPTPTPTAAPTPTPAPVCGDDLVNQGSEQCDGEADAACPGQCRSSCLCNQPPTLDAIGAQAVDLGSSLAFVVTANDPEGGEVGLMVTPLPLPPGATFDQTTGAFAFKPGAGHVGDTTLTFRATDDLGASATEAVGVTGNGPQAGAPAGLSGRVLDTNSFVDDGMETPVVGATVSLLGTAFSMVTGADGRFTLSGIPSGSQVLDIDVSTAQSAPDGSPYAGFRENIELLDGVHNVVDRPFFLPRIAVASLTTVDPALETVVVNADLGVTLVVPAGSAKNEDGTLFTGQLSISEVPAALAPAPLPSNLMPDLLITIQPVGVRFEPVAQITFENRNGFAADNDFDLWSLDPATGRFNVMGTNTVSADGTLLEPVSGGVVAADWHALLPPAPPTEPDEDGCCTTACCGSAATGSDTALAAGNLKVEHPLASFFSLGPSGSLSLAYDSVRADPRPIVNADFTILRRAAVPPNISGVLEVAGVVGQVIQYDASGFSESQDTSAHMAIQVDATSFPTGAYPYDFTGTAIYQPTSNVARGISSKVAGDLVVDNGRSSEFGAGWGIPGFSRLHEQDDGRVLITDGNGRSAVFEPGALPIDLSTWTAERTLNGELWELAPDSLSVKITAPGASRYTYFLSPFDFIDATLRGEFTVETTSDDDWVGLVFGFQSPVTTEGDDPTEHEYYLFDWRQANQSFFAGFPVQEGFSLARVSGSFPITADYEPEFGGHLESPPKYVLLGTRYGPDEGWADNVTHTFELTYETNRIRILIDGEVIFDVFGTFQPGRVGFYNFSQTGARYRAFFAPDGTTFVSQPGDFSRLVRNPDDSFARTFKDGTRHEYDAGGRLTAIVDRNGNATTYAYDGSNLLTTITDPAGRVTTLAYSGGRLSSITDPASRTTTLSHDARGDLRSITDPDGTTRQFEYDAQHRMTSQTSKRGFVTQYLYDFAGRFRESHLPDGSVRRVTPSAIAGLVDPDSGVGGSGESPAPVTLTSDVEASSTDGNGNVTRYTTDPLGQINRTIDPGGRVTEIERDADGNPTAITLPRGNGVRFTYDALGNVLEMRRQEDMGQAPDDLVDLVTTFTYEPQFNQVKTVTDPRGFTTTMHFDYELPASDPDFGEAGNVVRIVRPADVHGASPETRFSYTPTGQVAQQIDPNGIVSDFLYDPATFDLLQRIEDLGGIAATTINAYDAAGNATTLTDAEGRTATIEYDALNRIEGITDRAGFESRFFRDADGNLTRTERQANDAGTSVEVTQVVYDQMKRPVAATDPLGQTTASTYDDNGNIASITDPEGRSTTFLYEERNLLTDVLDARSPAGLRTFEYDDNGNLMRRTDEEGGATTDTFDGFDRAVSREYADGSTFLFAWDRGSNLTEFTSPRTAPAVTVENVYDALGRLVEEHYPQTPGLDTSFDYDPGSRLTVADVDDAAGAKLDFTYDDLNRMTTSTQTLGGAARVTGFQYDDVGNLTQITYPSGTTVGYEYDVRDRVSEVAVDGVPRATYAYDALDRRIAREYVDTPSPLRASYAYDAAGQLVEVDNTVVGGARISRYGYPVRNGFGNPTRRDRVLGLGAVETRSFAYDEIYQLIGVSGDETHVYAYDHAGNRMDVDGVSYVANPLNQYTQVGGATIEHDADGNLVEDGTRSHTYDDAGRLATSVMPSAVASYTYDALGRRVRKEVDGVATSFVYADLDVLAEYGNGGTLDAEYVFGEGIDEVLTMRRAGTTTYFHHDGLGTVTESTTAGGSLTESYAYDSYGEPAVASSTIGNPYRFAGRRYDEESGNYYFRARMYDPRLGRFLSRDPLGFLDGLNPYAYVDNDPVSRVDPFGLQGDSQDLIAKRDMLLRARRDLRTPRQKKSKSSDLIKKRDMLLRARRDLRTEKQKNAELIKKRDLLLRKRRDLRPFAPVQKCPASDDDQSQADERGPLAEQVGR